MILIVQITPFLERLTFSSKPRLLPVELLGKLPQKLLYFFFPLFPFCLSPCFCFGLFSLAPFNFFHPLGKFLFLLLQQIFPR